MTDIYAVADDVAVFNTFYLLESLVLTSYFEEPLAINHQVALIRHGKLMANAQL